MSDVIKTNTKRVPFLKTKGLVKSAAPKGPVKAKTAKPLRRTGRGR